MQDYNNDERNNEGSEETRLIKQEYQRVWKEF